MNILKKIVVVAIMTTLMIPVNAGTIKVNKENKGFWGYYFVTETHTDDFSQLNCTDPGHSRCKWIEKPANCPVDVITLNAYLAQIETEIDNGQINGNMSFAEISAEWSTNSEGITEITFEY